jgi:hypothetical protein
LPAFRRCLGHRNQVTTRLNTPTPLLSREVRDEWLEFAAELEEEGSPLAAFWRQQAEELDARLDEQKRQLALVQ